MLFLHGSPIQSNSLDRAQEDNATYRMVMFAEPMSPEVENLTPSLVTLMYTLSPIVARSLPAQHSSGSDSHTGNAAVS